MLLPTFGKKFMLSSCKGLGVQFLFALVGKRTFEYIDTKENEFVI